MRKVVILTVVALLTLSLATACKKSENSVTGLPNQTRTLSGQILTVGDLAGTSPSGINVSSNGLVAVTDGNGRFAFTSLPDKNVKIAFTRADGVEASTDLVAGASAVVIELTRRRASISVTGQSKRELEGLIQSITADEIVVNDARTGGPVAVKLADDTRIRKGNRILSWSDLEPGDRVHVKARVNGDGTLTAFEIMLQNEASDDDGDDDGNNGGQVKELEGTIVEVSSSSITVNNASTGKPETAAITEDTIIRKGNTRLDWDDLKPNDRVHVKTTGPRDALIAVQIMLQKSA